MYASRELVSPVFKALWKEHRESGSEVTRNLEWHNHLVYGKEFGHFKNFEGCNDISPRIRSQDSIRLRPYFLLLQNVDNQ